MARELRWWVVSLLAACGVIVAGYVPPRGAPPQRSARDGHAQATTARLRAQALADQWRAADLAVRLAQYRRQLQPALAQRREGDQPGPALLVEGPDSLEPSAREVVRTALDTVWGELGLGVTKVGVGVVVDFWRTRSTSRIGTPQPRLGTEGHLLPDSSDRATCVALIPAWYRTRTLHASGGPGRHEQVEAWLREGLGPCAFVAAWGVPGPSVQRWLARRNYDLARFPVWDREASQEPHWSSVRPTGSLWWWPGVYGHPVPAIGCLARRAASCRAAVLSGAGDSFDDSVPRLLTGGEEGWAWWRQERLIPGYRYLGDVAREVGHDRFQGFWSSPEAVDTALAVALKMPVGEWTKRWEARFEPRLPLGASAPLSAMALGLLIGAAAVVLVARGATRRQVG